MAGIAAMPFLAIAGLIFSTYLYFFFSDWILPGVWVREESIGGLRYSQAVEVLERRWNEGSMLYAIDLADPSRIWEIEPVEIGLRVDTTATVNAAHAIGRKPDIMESLWEIILAAQAGHSLEPIVAFDPVIADAALGRWEERVTVEPVDAQVTLKEGLLLYTEGRAGVYLDRLRTLQLLAEDSSSILLEYGFIPFVTKSVAPDVGDLSGVVSDVGRLLESKPVLRLYDPVTGEYFSWKPSREQIGGWILIRDEGASVDIQIDEAAIKSYIADIASYLGEGRNVSEEALYDALIDGLYGKDSGEFVLKYEPRKHVASPGDTWVSLAFDYGIPYWKIQEANPDYRYSGFSSGDMLTIPAQDALLELPVVTGKRILISIPEQRMWVYERGEIIREFVISTGIASSPTMAGIFQIESHYPNAYASIWDLYMPNFMGIYYAVPGLLNGIHGLPTLSNGQRLWANVLGSPASFGCIILDLPAAEWLYDWAEEGVVVEIRSD
jgi:hypothetical protein